MHQRLLFSLFSTTLLSIGGFISVLTTIDPYNTSFIMRLIFYLLFVAVIWGISSMIMYYRRHKKDPSKPTQVIWESMRQSLIIGVGVVGLIFFQTIDVLNILSATVYIIALVLIEIYFRLRHNAYV